MHDTETLFLVDDHKPQILELDVALEQTVRADDDIDFAFIHAFDDHRLLSFGFEAAQSLDDERVFSETLQKIIVMLLGENGRGDENRRLLPRHDAFEDRPHGDFGFSVADVSAKQTVHRACRFHVALDFLGRAELIARFGERERLLKQTLLKIVPRKRTALRLAAHRMNLEHVKRQRPHGTCRFALDFVPFRAADFAELDESFLGADVARDAVRLPHRNVDAGVVVEFQIERFVGPVFLPDRLQPVINADPVVDMDRVIAFLHVC